MLTTHLAMHESDSSRPGLLERLGRQLADFFGLADEPDVISSAAPVRKPMPPVDDTPTEPILQIVSTEPEVIDRRASLKWRRHPQLLGSSPSDLPPNEREARHEAVRGLFAARAGALDCAARHFSEAARCEDIDLSAIPGFWLLDRAAMATAVDAYEHVGRIRDASALNARIRTMLRPRALTPMPSNVTPLLQSAPKVSSNS